MSIASNWIAHQTTDQLSGIISRSSPNPRAIAGQQAPSSVLLASSHVNFLDAPSAGQRTHSSVQYRLPTTASWPAPGAGNVTARSPGRAPEEFLTSKAFGPPSNTPCPSVNTKVSSCATSLVATSPGSRGSSETGAFALWPPPYFTSFSAIRPKQ